LQRVFLAKVYHEGSVAAVAVLDDVVGCDGPIVNYEFQYTLGKLPPIGGAARLGDDEVKYGIESLFMLFYNLALVLYFGVIAADVVVGYFQTVL
jgi:hypothetical protein